MLTRRDFLKLMATLPLVRRSWQPRPITSPPHAAANEEQPNLLVLLFDAFSAKHASLYGYPRQTTPQMERFAQHATVYHAHYTGGSFTNPGTASLLTGTYPWTHRSMHLYSPMLAPQAKKNVYHALGDDYYSVSYSHNLIATNLLYQCLPDMDDLKMPRELCLVDGQWSDKLFSNDFDIAVWRERNFRGGGALSTYATSIFYYLFHKEQWINQRKKLEAQYEDRFPRGLPRLNDQIFILEDAIDWLRDHLPQLPQPFIVYFHFLPPHPPHCPSREFVDLFQNDGWILPKKPDHPYSMDYSIEDLRTNAAEYDEYIAYSDAEFGRLVDHIQQSTLKDNTYLLLTSDHGEMFERGIWGHWTETLYEELTRIPLIIHAPGQQERRDVHTPTSAVDVLPTLLHFAGRPIPDWCEGRVLPPYQTPDEATDAERSVFVVDGKFNAKRGPLQIGTVAMIKGPYKLIHYFGYKNIPQPYEMYNLQKDPEELNDIYATSPLAADLREELAAKLRQVNREAQQAS
jgi:arylsulfatase A-like enzyme